ncbi:hypothetical protein EVAR_487_1 [Eumeta japonica]|uniref:Uncharacterized protein n=1 Tax=Eumeta variegata TaxID=151549 RepID=A0A4C1SBG1_EUMVA|nr:hypothetical protein EVAR_487_1 [Eumeta japonica]
MFSLFSARLFGVAERLSISLCSEREFIEIEVSIARGRRPAPAPAPPRPRPARRAIHAARRSSTDGGILVNKRTGRSKLQSFKNRTPTLPQNNRPNKASTLAAKYIDRVVTARSLTSVESITSRKFFVQVKSSHSLRVSELTVRRGYWTYRFDDDRLQKPLTRFEHLGGSRLKFRDLISWETNQCEKQRPPGGSSGADGRWCGRVARSRTSEIVCGSRKVNDNNYVFLRSLNGKLDKGQYRPTAIPQGSLFTSRAQRLCPGKDATILHRYCAYMHSVKSCRGLLAAVRKSAGSISEVVHSHGIRT